MQPVAFTARQHTGFFLLIGSRKVKARQISPRIDFPASNPDKLLPAGHYFVHALIGLDGFVALIHVADPYCLSYFETPLVGFFQTHDQFKQGGFAGAVGAYNTNNTVGR